MRITMATICRPISEYRNIITSSGITADNFSPQKKIMKRFIRIFKEFDDARIQAMKEYPLDEILLSAFLAVLANASGWNEIEQFGIAKQTWLKNSSR